MSETQELEAGRELDALIAERVMGYVWRRARHAAVKGLVPPTGYDEILGEELRGDEARARDFARDVPEYSTDITAAWAVMEAMLARKMYPDLISSSGPVGIVWMCLVDWFAEDGDDRPPVSAAAPTVPLAICRAALKALPSPTPEGRP